MYFVAIVLPDELNQKVLKHKEYMFEKFGCKVGLKSPAHITLIPPFWMEVEKEFLLIEDLQRLNYFNPFIVQTHHFSSFQPRTIFIALSPNQILIQLKKLVDTTLEKNGYKIKAETRPFHPHITIATRDLHKKDFAQAWPHFEARKFEVDWLVQGISILRHNKKNWDVIFTSQFQNS